MPDIADFTDPVVAAIYEQYEKRGETEKARTYLGASVIGKECKRALWYSFRWAGTESFDGRMLRLFQTGHLAEPRFVADLRSIGATVWDCDPATGKQFGFSHFGGNGSFTGERPNLSVKDYVFSFLIDGLLNIKCL